MNQDQQRQADAELGRFTAEHQKKKVSTRNPIRMFSTLPKKYRIACALGFAAALITIGFLLFGRNTEEVVVEQQVTQSQPEPEPEPEPEPITKPSPLTGILVSPELIDRPVTGIMIENSTVARPQSGLLDAGVVFEAVAEGGITRFLALFQESRPDYIGPVRSARPYYVEWLAPFDAAYAHVGGDIAGRSAVAELISKDRDQFYYSGAYWRISSRAAPHNMYTSFDALDSITEGLSSNFTAWPRIDESPVATPQYSVINLSISSAAFNPVYTYDAAQNVYLRSFANGQKHTDERSGTQLQPKVVIAMQLGYSVYVAQDGARTTYNTVGSGKAWIFQNGTVTEATWSKPSKTAQLTFTDATGNEIPLVRGQTWISAVKGATWQ